MYNGHKILNQLKSCLLAFLENSYAMPPVTFLVKEIGSPFRNYLKRFTVGFLLQKGPIVI